MDPPHGNGLRFLAVGDSYTIGESVSAEDRWPEQLVHALRRAGTPMADPSLVATTGWTTDELATGIETAAPEGLFDLVSLMIGVNDQYRGRTVETFRGGFLELLGRATRFADDRPSRVIVVSIPDWGVTPFARAEKRDPAAVAREIDAFNDVIREEARTATCRIVDITDISRRAADDPGLIADDGLHPSALMYRMWTERLLPVVQAALADDRQDPRLTSSSPR